jgi:hypothetical protein
MFIMSLAAADITVGGIVMPISSVYAITGKWMYQTSDFHICYSSQRDGRINHFNAYEAIQLTFSATADVI